MKLGDFLLGYFWRVMQRDENLHTAVLMQYDSFTSTLLQKLCKVAKILEYPGLVSIIKMKLNLESFRLENL